MNQSNSPGPFFITLIILKSKSRQLVLENEALFFRYYFPSLIISVQFASLLAFVIENTHERAVSSLSFLLNKEGAFIIYI